MAFIESMVILVANVKELVGFFSKDQINQIPVRFSVIVR